MTEHLHNISALSYQFMNFWLPRKTNGKVDEPVTTKV